MKKYKWKSGKRTSMIKRKRPGKEGVTVKSYAIRINSDLWARIEKMARKRNTLRSRIIVEILEGAL